MYALSAKFHQLKDAIQKLGAGIHSGASRNYRKLHHQNFEPEDEEEGTTVVDTTGISSPNSPPVGDDADQSGTGKYQRLDQNSSSDGKSATREETGRRSAVAETSFDINHTHTGNGKYQRLDENSSLDEIDAGQEIDEDDDDDDDDVVDKTATSKKLQAPITMATRNLSTMEGRYGTEGGHGNEDHTVSGPEDEEFGAEDRTEMHSTLFNDPFDCEVSELFQHDSDRGSEGPNGVDPMEQSCGAIGEDSELFQHVSGYTIRTTELDPMDESCGAIGEDSVLFQHMSGYTPRTTELDPMDESSCGAIGEVSELFQHVSGYTPRTTELEQKLMPFLPDYIPAGGDTDPFIMLKRPDGKEDVTLGLTHLDEPSLIHSSPTSQNAEVNSFFCNHDNDGAENPHGSDPNDQRGAVEEPEVDLITLKPQNWPNTGILDIFSVP